MSAKGYVEHLGVVNTKNFGLKGGIKTRKHNNRISTRLNTRQRQAIEEEIVKGKHKNLSEFLRFAIEKATDV